MNSTLRVNGVMQCLAQNRKIDAVCRNRWIFNIAKPVLEVVESMFLCELRAELNHLGRIIHGDHFPRFLASNCESVPSPAPRSATVSGGSNVISVCASAFHDRPGT